VAASDSCAHLTGTGFRDRPRYCCPCSSLAAGPTTRSDTRPRRLLHLPPAIVVHAAPKQYAGLQKSATCLPPASAIVGCIGAPPTEKQADNATTVIKRDATASPPANACALQQPSRRSTDWRPTGAHLLWCHGSCCCGCCSRSDWRILHASLRLGCSSSRASALFAAGEKQKHGPRRHSSGGLQGKGGPLVAKQQDNERKYC